MSLILQPQLRRVAGPGHAPFKLNPAACFGNRWAGLVTLRAERYRFQFQLRLRFSIAELSVAFGRVQSEHFWLSLRVGPDSGASFAEIDSHSSVGQHSLQVVILFREYRHRVVRCGFLSDEL
jgi:hypothetical protein